MSQHENPNLTSLACVVRAEFPGLKDTFSTCGFVLHPGEGLVLSHGSILAELCTHTSDRTLLQSNIESGEVISHADLNGCTFTVLLDKCWGSANLSVTHSLTTATERTNNNSVYHHGEDKAFSSFRGNALGAFRAVDFHDAVCKMMPEDTWSFAGGTEEESVTRTRVKNQTEEEESDELRKSVSFQLLSYFVLIKCDPLVYFHAENPQSSSVSLLASAERPLRRTRCTIGTEAEIISTPFGGLNPYVFFNSYSKGVISNVFGHDGCWVLTDARCMPGSEGSPLFTVHQDRRRELRGIVAASLCWKNKEWVGFTLVCGIDSIFKTLTSHIKSSLSALDWHGLDDLSFSSHQCRDSESQLSKTDGKDARNTSYMPFVVLVKVGRVWGSGFIIDTRKGLILTCSHVIKDASLSDPPIFIRGYNNSLLCKASVIYRQTSQEISPFDLAVLRCPEVIRHLAPLKPPKIVPALIGQRVRVCGHAVFNTDLGLQPSVCAGVISKVVRIRGQDVMVQSTCAVHAGASGGPLLDLDGNLVGIVVCNTVDKGSNSTYPHINFSIPATTIWPSVQHYIKTADASMMNSLKVTDPLVKKLWALDTTLETYFTAKSKL